MQKVYGKLMANAQLRDYKNVWSRDIPEYDPYYDGMQNKKTCLSPHESWNQCLRQVFEMWMQHI